MTDPHPGPLALALGVPKSALRVPDHDGRTIRAGRIEIDGEPWFVKSAPTANADPLCAESDGLEKFAAKGMVDVPTVRTCAESGPRTWLVLEWLNLQPLSARCAETLGEQLAEHHRCATSERYGLDRDNWIGATPQTNGPNSDWTDFLFEQRIGAMLDRAATVGIDVGPDPADRLREAWTRDFADYRPVPSLLHGDLWAGNAGQLPDGSPVVFDPAVHYGDRECDLAMADLFGGFGSAFFDAYETAWPLEPGWQRRREVYQLYHVLNHALLFGGGYVADARHRIERFIEPTR